MIKFITDGDYKFDVCSLEIITDSRQLTKRASSIDLLKFEKVANQTDVHLIALGSTENYGPNRNGDGFSDYWCNKKHSTFVKAARALHRNHKNKKHDPKFGNIKASAHNQDMGRIELIIGMDNDKCAKELDDLDKGKQVPFSMASRQEYDVCSFCGKKAHNDSERCHHIPDKIGEINKQGKTCYMDNPDPNWFEMSIVRRPADRIAYSLKLASDTVKPFLKQSDIFTEYPDFEFPKDEIIISKKASAKRHLLEKLSELEKRIDAIANGKVESAKDKYIRNEAGKGLKTELSDSTIDELRKFEPSKLLKVLADHGIILPPGDFSKYLFGDKVNKSDLHSMKSHLGKGFQDKSEDDAKVLHNEHYDSSSSDMIPKELKNLISKLTGDHSIFDKPAHARVMRISICGKGDKLPLALDKQSSDMGKELADQYIAYKLAALHEIDKIGKLDEETMINAVIQNRL